MPSKVKSEKRTGLIAATAAIMLAAAAPAAGDVPRPSLPNPAPTIVTVDTCPLVHSSPPPVIAAAGCYDPINRIVYTNGDRETTLHELGHAASERLDVGEWNRFQTVTGHRGEPHDQIIRYADGLSLYPRDGGVERFADVYAHCRAGDKPYARRGRYMTSVWWSSTDYMPPSNREHRMVCGFVVRALAD